MSNPIIVSETPLSQRIHTVAYTDLGWPFEKIGQANAPVKARHKDAWGTSVSVDPFPCYAHDPGLVEEIARSVEAAFPIGCPPSYHLLEFEDASRTNGHAGQHHIYHSDSGKRDQEPYIVLSGKRIPLHPGMTRYLVAHEYGHCADWWICQARGIDTNKAVTDFDKEYAALRGLDIDQHTGYGGRKWHTAIGELIANDFRICVTGFEPEFWPHPGFAHPHDLPAVQEFWRGAVENWAFRPATSAD